MFSLISHFEGADMKIHANILDTILNTATQAPNRTSALLGDYFMDAELTARPRSGGRGRIAAAVAGDGELAEAFSVVAASERVSEQQKQAKKFTSVRAAVEWAKKYLVLAPGTKLSAAQQENLTAARQATLRLARLLTKSAEQMQQDGASKIADYFDPLIVPGWAKQVRADFNLLQSLRDASARLDPKTVRAAVSKAASQRETPKTAKANLDIKRSIRAWLNEGVEPRVIADRIEKTATVEGFSKSIATEYLNDHAGVLGLAYIEPNHYMNDCPQSYNRMEVKLGGVQAKAVKQITACKGCQYFKQAAGQKTCTLYKLPVIASQTDLMPIINNLTANAKNKKAALVSLANHDELRATPSKKVSSAVARTGAKGAILDRSRQKKAVTVTFTASDVLKLHNEGLPLGKILAQGTKVAGVVQARTAIRQFVAGLKGTRTRIALTQIDCQNLTNKLGSSNQIFGDSRCLGCTYRNGMHCGKTGGTLVTFPGMDKMQSKSAAKVQPGAPTDGHAMLREFEMGAAPKQADIQIGQPNRLDVELTGTSKVDL